VSGEEASTAGTLEDEHAHCEKKEIKCMRYLRCT